MIRNQSGQIVSAQLVSAVTGLAFAGSVSVYLDGDHTGQILGSVSAGAANARGNGLYDYLPTAGETDFAHIAFSFIGSGAVPALVQIDTITAAQISSLQTASGIASVAAGQIVTEALLEIGVARLGDVIDQDLMAYGVSKLNRLLDRWNADPRAAYTMSYTSYTPVASQALHTLGPNSADWTVTQRPTMIRAANLILNTVTPAVRLTIEVIDDQDWQAIPVQGLGSSMPRKLYYRPDWPNGSVYLFPVPTSTYPIELITDTLFDVLSATDAVWMPFGYRDAVTLTLAEELAPGNGQQPSPTLVASAAAARALIFGANDAIPRLVTRVGGMPSGRGGVYDYKTGLVR